MGAGRKTQTIVIHEKTAPPWAGHGIDTARNLRTSDLAAVIFGCKHNTMEECFSNQLFGLPAPHFTYVKNIYPSLPLFLFNYSDRKLHGIFEAASHGRMNMNPHAWTVNGSDSTPYPAQVKFRITKRCQPLVEEQFRPIIAENYHAPRLFWFELDQDQTNKLISLFSSSLMTQNQNSLFKSSFDSNARENQRLEGHIDDNGGKQDKKVACLKPSSGLSYSSVVKNMSSSNDPSFSGKRQQLKARANEDVAENHMHKALCRYPSNKEPCSSSGMGTSLPQKPWSALFNNKTASDARRETEDLEVLALESKFSEIDQHNSECVPPSYINQEIHVLEVPVDNKDSELCGTLAIVDRRQEAKEFSVRADHVNSEWSLSCVPPCLDEESETSKLHTDRYVPEEENLYHESNSEYSLYVAMANMVIAEDNPGEVAEVHSREAVVSDIMSSDFYSVVGKLLLEVQELKRSQSMQAQKINFLEQELVESRIGIQQLKDRCNVLESSCLKFDGMMLVAGGFDGSLWLSGLDSYSPFQDQKRPLASMNSARSYAAAANLNGELCMLGGGHDNIWYDTVEAYNPARNQWAFCPPLNQRKGHLAAVPLYEKIFALGGGHGANCLSEVEMLDINAGRWILVQSMLDKRFAPAAAEINGIIYAVGGCNGTDYLNSVERLDPREHSWTQLEGMIAKRGCHSLAVLNEKLYALGGYDGQSMVRTVEVFDPRVGSWMREESMSDSRGYFGAVSMRDSIYVFGGLNDEGKILDMVECYTEGQGWQMTDLKEFGKRCFFSAVVL